MLDGRRGLVPSNFVEKLEGEELFDFHQQVVLGLGTIHILRNHLQDGASKITKCPKMFTKVLKGSKMSQNIPKCPKMSQNVLKCPKNSQNVSKYPKKFHTGRKRLKRFKEVHTRKSQNIKTSLKRISTYKRESDIFR